MIRLAPLPRGLQRLGWSLVICVTTGAGVVSAQMPEGAPILPPLRSEESAVSPRLGPAPADPAAIPCPPAPSPASAADPRWQTPFPRPGAFFVLPTGPGYYSVLDRIRGNYRDAAPKYPYPRFGIFPFLFADVNWTYLKNPDNADYDYADFLKWIPVGNGVTLNTGGEVRYQFRNDVNSVNRLTGVADAYNLYRTRIYTDLWVQDWLRMYGEFLYADYANRTLPPLPIDADRGDLLNLFADLRILRFGAKDNPVYLRAGRQELLYGSQRLISPLTWVNSRRTFEGFKVFARTENWDFDVFGVWPVLVRASQFDTADHNQFFSGAWFTYRPIAGQNIDLYYLNLDNNNLRAAIGNGGVPGNYNVSTFGSRYVGAKNNWLWDLEGMLQTGHYSNQSIIARSFVALGGYHFKGVPWEPQVWAGYDYASGDPDPQHGVTHRTFNQLFPFSHPYFGFLDLVARQNINDFFLQEVMFPAKWLTLLTKLHVLRLDSNRDALYSAGGAPIRRDPMGQAGNDIGNELDLLASVHLTAHSDFLLGYSILFAGSYLKNTTPPGPRAEAMAVNPQMFYMQYTYRW